MRRRVGAVAGVVLALALLAPASASAQPTPAAGAARLELRSLTGALQPGDDLTAVVRVRNLGRVDLDELRVVATLHRRTFSRLDYQLAVDQGEVGTVLHAFSEVLEPLPGRRFREVELTQSAAELGLIRPGDQLGVYPLQLRLLAGEEVVDELTTSVVLAPAEIDNPVRTALLLPLDAPPALRAEGPYARGSLVEDLGTRGRLRGLVDAPLDRSPTALTVASSGLLLDQVAALADDAVVDGTVRTEPTQRHASRFADRLRELAGREVVEVVSLSYGPGDLVALARHGARDEVRRHLRGGTRALTTALDSPVTASILWPPDGVSRAVLEEATSLGVDTVVLSEAALAFDRERDLPFTPSPHRRLNRDGGGVRLLVPDPWLERTLAADSDRGAAMAAQRILGETAAVFFERPYATEPRGLLLAPPREWDPPVGLPGALPELLDNAPWVEAVTLSGLAEAVPVQPDAVRLAAPEHDRGLDRAAVAGIAAGRASLSAARRVVEDDAAMAAERAEQLLLAAGSVHVRPPRTSLGRSYSATVSEQAESLFAAISLVESPPVLLSSIEGQVPVTLRNDAPVPLRVRVRLETQRYEFSDGPVTDALTLPAQSTSTLAFTARARAPGGVHQIGVSVEDLRGDTTLTTGTIVVRSTAVSTTALLITAAAVLFLFGWWARESARRRRDRRPPGRRSRRPAPSGRPHDDDRTADAPVDAGASVAPSPDG